MRNLAGVKNADAYIIRELTSAGIDWDIGEIVDGEVPYSVTGDLGPWHFRRAWEYWVAEAPHGKGLPPDIADKLYFRKYPLPEEAKTYGEVIDIVYSGSDRLPSNNANHFDAEGRLVIIDPSGDEEAKYNRLKGNPPGIDPEYNNDVRFVREPEGVVVKSSIDLYHIREQEGLNEFARVVKSIYSNF